MLAPNTALGETQAANDVHHVADDQPHAVAVQVDVCQADSPLMQSIAQTAGESGRRAKQDEDSGGGSGWDYDAIAEACMNDSQWLSDSQLKLIDSGLTDSQLWGKGDWARVGRKDEDDALAKLHALEGAIRTIIQDIDDDGGDGDMTTTDNEKIVLPLHLEVRALGTHLTALRSRCNALASSLEQERKNAKDMKTRVNDLTLQLARHGANMFCSFQ